MQGGDASPKPSALSHPKGLYVLFFTEMWERFSYYGMRALLVPYMLNYLLFQPAASSSTYKWYTSLVYLTPLLGGLVADRFLGLRASIVVGGVLMAVGHILMAFEPLPFFYAALAFLICGNGFFKPNISTLVGKMYKADDVRRDGAFTIFYMGINLGAFLAPLTVGLLRQHFGPHHGFAAAGVGMGIGLAIFLLGQRRVLADVEAAGNTLESGKAKVAEEHAPDPDERVPRAGGGASIIAKVFPFVIVSVGLLIAGYYAHEVWSGREKPIALIMPTGFLAVFVGISIMLTRIRGASRDKSTVIFVLFVAAVLFWMTFEQAGNTLNIWASTHTDLQLASFQIPAEWFQSVNALLIFTLGLPFAAMWVALAKRGIEPPTPLKMAFGLALVACSFVPLVIAAANENATVSRQALAELPPGIELSEFDAGRLGYDPSRGELHVRGVLPSFTVQGVLGKTVPPSYQRAIEELDLASKSASAGHPVEGRLAQLPPGFRFPLDEASGAKLGLSGGGSRITSERLDVNIEADHATFVFRAPLDARAKGELIVAGADAPLRASLRALERSSQAARVSGVWLLLHFLLATLGELCLSPVGISMVTKLAPARFASLFMGVWLLASSVAQYAGGTIGERWGKITPSAFFQTFVWIGLAGAAVLLLIVRPLRKLMHGVH